MLQTSLRYLVICNLYQFVAIIKYLVTSSLYQFIVIINIFFSLALSPCYASIAYLSL